MFHPEDSLRLSEQHFVVLSFLSSKDFDVALFGSLKLIPAWFALSLRLTRYGRRRGRLLSHLCLLLPLLRCQIPEAAEAEFGRVLSLELLCLHEKLAVLGCFWRNNRGVFLRVKLRSRPPRLLRRLNRVIIRSRLRRCLQRHSRKCRCHISIRLGCRALRRLPRHLLL